MHFSYQNLKLDLEICSVLPTEILHTKIDTVCPHYNAIIGVHNLLTVLWVDLEARQSTVVG